MIPGYHSNVMRSPTYRSVGGEDRDRYRLLSKSDLVDVKSFGCRSADPSHETCEGRTRALLYNASLVTSPQMLLLQPFFLRVREAAIDSAKRFSGSM